MELTSSDVGIELRKERLYIIILAAIQIVHILDFVIMMPLGPMFMRVFNISPAEFSTLVAAYTFSAGIVGFFGAFYADHFDRKKFLLFNFAGFIIGTFLCALSPNFAALLAARIVAGAFGGVLNATVLSLVSDLIPFERRGKAMGVVMSSFSVSSIVGIPLGLWIANKWNWHASFYFICAVAMVFWIMGALVLPSVKEHLRPKKFKETLQNFKNVIIQWNHLQAFLLTSVLGFGIFGVIPFIAPYMVRNVGMKETDLPFIYLIGGIFTIVMARIVGVMSDKVGSYRVFKVLALIALVPMFVLTNLPPVPLWLALVVTTCFTMFGSARFIPAMTLVSAVVKKEERGTFMSLENAGRQISSGAASQFAGLIIGANAAGGLTHYNVVGYIAIITTLIGIYIASLIRTKYNLR